MAVFMAEVRYSYQREGSKSKTTTTTAFQVPQQSETMVMQKLEKKHPNCEIELVSLKWR